MSHRTRKRQLLQIAVALALALVPASAMATLAGSLLGKVLTNERGDAAGRVEDLLVDVEANRVLYVIVDARSRFRIFPIRALGEDLRLDVSLAGEIAAPDRLDDARFQRMGKLLGQALTSPQPGGPVWIGEINDIEFDPASGDISRVIVRTGEGQRAFAPDVLAHRRFPPISDAPRERANEDARHGFLRREPSDARQRLHDPWGR